MSNNPQLYRETTVGVTLQETLDEMISQGALTQSAASKILMEFDRSINAQLGKQTPRKIHFGGKLNTYRFCDSVWTFVLKDFVTKESGAAQQSAGGLTSGIPSAAKVKIVACDGKAEAKNSTA